MALTRMHATIERKQTTQDQMNKRLEQLVSSSGGEELGSGFDNDIVVIFPFVKIVKSHLDETF